MTPSLRLLPAVACTAGLPLPALACPVTTSNSVGWLLILSNSLRLRNMRTDHSMASAAQSLLNLC
jgi:hypothetical protein